MTIFIGVDYLGERERGDAASLLHPSTEFLYNCYVLLLHRRRIRLTIYRGTVLFSGGNYDHITPQDNNDD